MSDEWNGEALLALARSYQPACVLLAAAELGVFEALDGGPSGGRALAEAIGGDLRATTILADALVALGLLEKRDGMYAAVPNASDVAGVLPMLRHQGACLRQWSRIGAAVERGGPVERIPSVSGADADRASFIEAMEVAARNAAPSIVANLGPPPFDHLLDVGGGPATWTIAFLNANPTARATLFDLPDALPIARRHLEAAGLADRVDLVGGDFFVDALPGGADLAWVSAIVHQNSRQQNRDLLSKVHAALADGGQIMIRDIVMDDTHTHPPVGALFAVNMLVHTEGGGTFSLAELTEDLDQAGFGDVAVIPAEREMDNVVRATKRP